jgi:DNA-binding CsgD family transcriptional regulator
MGGDADGAAALFARAHALWRSTQDRLAVVPLLLEGCLFHAARGDAREAAEWADDLERVAGSNGGTPVAAAAASHARGAALAAAGDHAAARERLREAVARWDTLGRPYDAARARAALGAAVLASSRGQATPRAEADALLVAAGEEFTRLGALHAVAQVEETRRRGGLLSQARRRHSLAAQRAPYGDLTPREREVLALLAEGCTNRDIAHALFITEGTAELHVSHILGKLGCATRAQAAAYAVAHGLVSLPEPPKI